MINTIMHVPVVAHFFGTWSGYISNFRNPHYLRVQTHNAPKVTKTNKMNQEDEALLNRLKDKYSGFATPTVRAWANSRGWIRGFSKGDNLERSPLCRTPMPLDGTHRKKIRGLRWRVLEDPRQRLSQKSALSATALEIKSNCMVIADLRWLELIYLQLHGVYNYIWSLPCMHAWYAFQEVRW